MKFASYPYHLVILLVFFGFYSNQSTAQLGFCQGNSGDPIFYEDFGAGTTNGPALPSDVTSYIFDPNEPDDGEYNISANTQHFGWHDTDDHTPGDVNGRCLIVNADYTAGEFYRTTISGLCENTSYEFSSWLINLSTPNECGGSTIPINVRFEIWDDTDTLLLARGDTGSIFSTATPIWQQYALVFQTEPSQTSIILKMKNNGNGGCGNDLAIDDILFRTCGDKTEILDDNEFSYIEVCANQTPYELILTANPDNSVFESHAFQWQYSEQGNDIWEDIAGENNDTLELKNLTSTGYYRVKFAEDDINLSNSQCSIISEYYYFGVVEIPDSPISEGDVEVCNGELGSLNVVVPSEASVSWYDSPVGGNLLQENSTSYSPSISGTYYAEAYVEGLVCNSLNRTAVSFTINDRPVLVDEEGALCSGDTITLSANFPNATYQWNTGATTESIEITAGGSYSVTVTNTYGCDNTKYFEIEEIPSPDIESVVSDGPAIIVSTATNGDFEYSLNGANFQISNRFNEVQGGLYTIYVRELNGCGTDTMPFHHFVIPKFFTPNNDGRNDTFNLRGIEYFESSSVQLFDRYGNLIKSARNQPFNWDGTKDNRELPSTDYWYVIVIEGQEIKGHVALRR